ncbi:MAG: 2Fe-2S iron-sulfur cluster-binding protein [Desulfobacteraceae bacterium]|nr:2Fe-2S iron-sulfur cluster-binding protein [Desulfobacteraceae bacterium]MDH3565725.1 2Fe-2S iron-sulfur cluster-binding protein [Desulfobacteraceae bacterium]
MPKLWVDGKEIETKQGTTLLQACLDNDIYIPNLCFLESMEDPSASCRMCFVEIEGEKQPMTSCTVKVEDDMVVKTDTPAVRQLQRAALRLLLSVHHVDCKHCPANKKCELQRIAKFLKVGLKPKGLERYLKETEIDRNHPFLNHYPNRCVLCGKCVHICRREHDQSALTFAKRGFDTVISAYGQGEASSLNCEKCDVCVKICPVGALTLKETQEGG